MRELGWALGGAALLVVQLVVARACLMRPAPPTLELVVADARVVPRSASGAPPGDARVRAADPARVEALVDDAPAPAVLTPGWHRQSWAARYGAGGERRVTRSVLAGPFQTRDAPPCGVRLVVGQALLDGLAAPLRELLHAELRGQLGYRAVDRLTLTFDGAAQALVVTAVLRFMPGVVRLRVALVPVAAARGFTLESTVRAEVGFGSSAVTRLVDSLGQTERVNRLVTDVARGEVERALAPVAAILATPPPVPLDGGVDLELAPCAGTPIMIHDHAALVVPLAVLPPEGGPPPRLPDAPSPSDDAALAGSAPLALELDGNALDAVLAHLHARGVLDRALGAAGLDTRFNTDAAVTSWLTVRTGPPRLAAAPLLERGDGGALHLAVELAFDLRDGALITPAYLFTRLALTAGHDARGALTAAAHVVALDLTCAPAPDRLAACYPLLMDRARAASGALDAPIADALVAWLGELLVAREIGGGDGELGASLGTPRLTLHADQTTPWLRATWQVTPRVPR